MRVNPADSRAIALRLLCAVESGTATCLMVGVDERINDAYMHVFTFVCDEQILAEHEMRNEEQFLERLFQEIGERLEELRRGP